MALSSDKDRVAERRAADKLERIWNCKINRLFEFDRTDYYRLTPDEKQVTAGVEIKRRYNPMGQYSTVYLALRKWMALQFTDFHFDAEGLFVVQFDDALAYVRMNEISVRKIGWSGRTDRNIGNDMEPIIEVPIDCLHILEVGPA